MQQDFTTDNKNLIRLLGIYQLVGSFKCALSFLKSFYGGHNISGINILLFFLLLVLILFGAISGAFCLISEEKGLKFSFYNQILQLVSFTLFGLTYFYIAGFDISFCLNLSSSTTASIQFGFSKGRFIFENNESLSIFRINLASLGIIFLIDRLSPKAKAIN